MALNSSETICLFLILRKTSDDKEELIVQTNFWEKKFLCESLINDLIENKSQGLITEAIIR